MTAVENSKELFSATFPSSKVKRKKIIDTVISKVIQTPISLNIKNHELYLIIDEAISNAMEHGNSWDPHQNITITISTENRNLIISVEDQGIGFNPEAIDTKTRSIRPRGRGIQIMKHFCEMKWNDKGNIVNLILKLR